MSEEILALERQVKQWKEIATHFADISAATAEDLLGKKSTSKHERERQISICKHAAECLKSEAPTGVMPRSTKSVIDRLEEAVRKNKTA